MKDRKWWSTLWRSEPAPQRHSAPPQVSGRDAADPLPHISFSFLNEAGTAVVKSPNISSINLQSVNIRHGEGTYSSPRGSTALAEDPTLLPPESPPSSPTTLDQTAPTTGPTTLLEPLNTQTTLTDTPSNPSDPKMSPDHHILSTTPTESENNPTTLLEPSVLQYSPPPTPTIQTTSLSTDGNSSPTLATLDPPSRPLDSPPSTPTTPCNPVPSISSIITPVSSANNSTTLINLKTLYQSSDTTSLSLDSPPITATTSENPITIITTTVPDGSETTPQSSIEPSSSDTLVLTLNCSTATPPTPNPDTTSSPPIMPPTTPSHPRASVVPEDGLPIIDTSSDCPTGVPSVDNTCMDKAACINIASSTSTLVADSRPVSPRTLTISLPLELGSCADWETITELSEFKHESDYEDVVTRDEYCEHRAQDPRRRRVRGIMRARIRRAWRAVRGWWSEERLRITDVIQRHAQEQPDNNVVRRRQDNSRPCSRAGARRSRYIPEGQNGFEELRRYIKQGGDFCKDLSAILQERSEAETQYAKSLSKLSGKLLKASRDSVGTVTQAWQRAGTQMEAQSEVHRAFATALSEEVVKPLRQLIESQHRIRKSVESAVDKTGKSLSEWRSAESKSKKQSFMSARENEKLQDAMLDVRLGRASSSTHLHLTAQHSGKDKDASKLESKRRKAEEAVKKADVEYYTFSMRAERSRLEWETAVIRGSHCFQALEEERLQQLKDLATCYLNHLQEIGPKMVQGVDRLREPVEICDVARDIQTVVSIKGTGQPIPEQLLPDFYAEHITLAMNRDRRRQALVKLLQLIRQDLDRERRGKQGVENLARALQQTPTFGAEDSQQNVTEKLHHMRSMLTYLEAMRYKVQSALAELDGRTRGGHPLAAHIQVTRDRQGLQQSVLKVPPWVREESLDRLAGDSPDWTDRGTADGNSVQPDSDFDEFSSQGSEKDYQSSVLTQCPVISQPPAPPVDVTPSIGCCKALYEYTANLYDELNLQPGDIIKIHDKQADGWWLGELNGVVGIFPATYVQEID